MKICKQTSIFKDLHTEIKGTVFLSIISMYFICVIILLVVTLANNDTTSLPNKETLTGPSENHYNSDTLLLKKNFADDFEKK